MIFQLISDLINYDNQLFHIDQPWLTQIKFHIFLPSFVFTTLILIFFLLTIIKVIKQQCDKILIYNILVTDKQYFLLSYNQKFDQYFVFKYYVNYLNDYCIRILQALKFFYQKIRIEPMKLNLGISALLAKAKLVLYTVLQFLDSDDVSNLYQLVKCEQNSSGQSIVNILEGYIYIRFNMNGSDRSYYNFVYSSPLFLNIEKSIIAYHVQSTNNFKYFYHLSKHLHNYLLDNLKRSNSQQTAQDIWHIFNDPDIPTLKLLRQTVGIGCKSLFQNFFVSFNGDSYSLTNDEYPSLSKFYQKRTDQAYIKQFFKIDRSKHKTSDFLKIKKLRYSAYYIKCQEMETYFLPQNQIHNLLVILFSIADLMVQSSQAYLYGIQDPYYRLMQFSLRYSLYRNFVLNIQEKFSFLFQIYSSIYQDVFIRQSIPIPTFSFWRPALGKWLLYMSKYHQQCIQIVNLYTLTKRQKNLISSFDALVNKPIDCMTIQNSLNMFRPQNFCKLQRAINKQIYQLIEEELQYSVHQFKQYLVDLSIDQVTVNWCGYSQQELGMPYRLYQNRTLNINQLFIDQLIKTPYSINTALLLLKIDLKYVQKNQLYHQRILVRHAQQIEEKLSEQSKIQQINIQFKYEFHNSDEKIKQFNEKQKIPYKIQNEKSYELYQINPIPQQQISQYIEMKSIQTMDNSNEQYLSQNSEQYIEQIDYHSQNEIYEQKNTVQINQIQDFFEDWSKIDNENQSIKNNSDNLSIMMNQQKQHELT